MALERAVWVLAIFAAGFGWISLARRRVLKKFGIKRTRYRGHAFWFALFFFLLLLFLSLFVFVILEIVERVYRVDNLPYFLAVFGTFVLLFHYSGSVQFLKKSTKDPKTGLDMGVAFTRLALVPLLLSPLSYKAYYDLGRNSKRARLRDTPPAGTGKWSRLNRDALKPAKLNAYLSRQQLAEEKLGAKSYEIWLNEETGRTHIAAFDGEKISKYEVCPKCHGQTLAPPAIKVRQRATRTSTGVGERMRTCAFCNHAVSLGMVTLAALASRSSSGSGSGGGGGSSGGGSSGSSFGGGSSGGGGAGGRW